MKESWEARRQRAEQLAAQSVGVGELLTFYAALLGAQQQIDADLRRRPDRISADKPERELSALCALTPGLLATVEAHGPEPLAREAQMLRQAGETELEALLQDYWHGRSDLQFFAKALLQPWAGWLAETGWKLPERTADVRNRCPVCAGRPQLAVLRPAGQGADGGNRSLLCATCLTEWPFRRVVCAQCGEERPAKLGYFSSPSYDHVRIEACDSCGYYLKGIDLTRFGLAVPLVDEVAAAPLDLWAREHGYTKIELNLVGL
ncbi:MAG TPA: formate dehydrogenase accessory protein FdhE [Blastocatellia bacterium]|nr:formate dehydrogenase accessory protein FdhE [Blastocatellia bacterium]